MRRKCFTAFVALFITVAALAPWTAGAYAQTLFTSLSLPSDSPFALGQAQPGHVAWTENDVSSFSLWDTNGGALSPMTTVGLFARAVESTDDSLFVIVAGGPTLRKYTRAGTLTRSVSLGGFADIPRRILPLDDGRVLLAFTNADPARVLKIFDRHCVLVDSLATPLYDGAAGTIMGLTRTPDGGIVTCMESSLGNVHLTRYGPAGHLEWTTTIPAGGSVASDPRGTLYVCHGANTTTLDLYSSTGVPSGSWSGPSGQPLVRVSDIVSSRDGEFLFVLTNGRSGPLQVFTNMPVPASRTTWGALKTRAR